MTETAYMPPLTDDEVRFLRMLMGRLKKGRKEKPSDIKLRSLARVREVREAVRRGDEVEANRLRWLYWPERMRREELARQMKGA